VTDAAQPPQRDDTQDVVSLWRLQAAYADLVSRRAWNELDTVFLPDTTVEVDTVSSPASTCIGADGFAAFVGPATDRFDHFQFVILNTVVDLDGPEEANGRIFMCEIRHEIAIDDWTTAYGIYQDRYRKVDGRWWFAARRYRSLARTGPQNGIFGVPPDLPQFGR
jgi:hypothetical protein